VAAEIQLLTCSYPARCSVRQCQARATMLARYTDNQGRPLKQRELCNRHADWLRANRPNVYDMRNGPIFGDSRTHCSAYRGELHEKYYVKPFDEADL
jgi:hypothetical protein